MATRAPCERISGLSQEPSADLMMMLGDNAYNSGTESEYQGRRLRHVPTVLQNTFLWPALGNHETSQSQTTTEFPYLDIFSLPTAAEAGGVASGNERSYSFDYANIHFVCLDSMTSRRAAANGPMLTSLTNDLSRRSRSSGLSRSFIIRRT